MKLVYSEEELLTSHEYVRPHVIGDSRLHGGFIVGGEYQPPRSKLRQEAIDHWLSALNERGGELLATDASWLVVPRVPNVRQQCLLIKEGLGQSFWNGLTTTGKIEARGRMLATTPFPNLQDLVVEDISEMAIGHLNKGLLIAHGVDEGGEPEKGIGGHDQMWFIARDLAFGKDAWPDVEPPSAIGRDSAGKRWMPQLSQPIEMYLSFLMNLLVIEFRAENGFADTQRILRTPGLFESRREQAELAAEIVERIRTDERIHVLSLRLYLGELRSLNFRTIDDNVIPGKEVIDPFWDNLIRWSTGDQPRLIAKQAYDNVTTLIQKHTEGDRVRKEFDSLQDAEIPVAAG